MRKIKKINLILMFFVLWILFVNQNKIFATDNESLNNSSIIELKNLEYKYTGINVPYYDTADIDEDILFLISNDVSYYYFTTYDINTNEVLKIKKIKYKDFPLEYVNNCKFKKDGNIILSNDSEKKQAIYDSNFKYIKTENIKSTNQERMLKDAEKNKLITNEYTKYNNFAMCSRETEFSKTYTTAFYDEPDYIYFEKNNDFEFVVDGENRKVFAKLNNKKDNNSVEFELIDYKYQNKRIVKVDEGNFYYGKLDDEYAFFVMEDEKDEKIIHKFYVWDFKNQKSSNYSVIKLSSDELKAKNNKQIKKIKSKYKIDVYVDKAEKDPYYKLTIQGCNPYTVYVMLQDIKGFLSYLPKKFTSEIKDTEQNKNKKLSIYIIKKIEDEKIGAYANTTNDEAFITFQTNCFMASFVPHEFMHLIDQRIYERYWNENKDFNDEWNKQNPNGRESYRDYSLVDVEYDYKSFISGYSMTNEWEDRAEMMGNIVTSYINKYNIIKTDNLIKKSKFLAKSIRDTYSSTKNVKDLIWERGLVTEPKNVEIKTSESKIKISWKENKKVSGFQIQQRINKRWKNITKQQKNTYTISQLDSGKKYSIRIRAYKKLDDVNYYSEWIYVDTATKPTVPKMKDPIPDNGKIKVKWKNVSETTGYQIKISKNKDFKKDTYKYIVSDKNKNSYVINRLKNGKYYVKIRSYKQVDGKKYYSNWSDVKTVKCK